MLAEPNGPEWRCWNGLDAAEYAALTESRRPLEGCRCRGCLFLVVRNYKPIPRSELTRTLNKDAGNTVYSESSP